MNKAFRSVLLSLAGVDTRLVSALPEPVIVRYSRMGGGMVIVLLLSSLSILFAGTQILGSFLGGVFLAVFFSVVVYNFIRLSVVSAEPFDRERKREFSYLLSIVSRFAFLIFLSFFISKPLEGLLFYPLVVKETNAYKPEFMDAMMLKFEASVAPELGEMEKLIKQLEQDYQLRQNPDDLNRLNQIKEEREFIQTSLVSTREKWTLELASQPMFLRGVLLLNAKYPFVWIISVLVAVLFVLPVFLRMQDREGYFALTQEQAKRKIEYEYKRFKENYSRILSSIAGEPIEYYEPYLDPPYNTRKRTEVREGKTQKEFLEAIYDQNPG